MREGDQCLDFHKLLSEPQRVEVIASGGSVKIRAFLNRHYGEGRWRKMKGIATVETYAADIVTAEVHWYEAHGVGRCRFKLKRVFRDA